MPAPLTERELLIARLVFNSAMQTCLEMAKCGFNPESFCRLALDDPQKDQHLRDKLLAELEFLEQLEEALDRASGEPNSHANP